MVVHAFPAAKLGALLVKQISKPIANFIKSKAKSHPVFRKYVCLPPAQFYNWCEVKSKMWLLQFGQPVNISVLNEEASIELGANLLGEAVIFIIAAGILIAEYNRSSNKEAAKEAKKKAEMEDIQNTLRELFIQSEEQGAHIRELTRRIGCLESRVVKKPWAPKSEPPPPEPPSGGSPSFVTVKDEDDVVVQPTNNTQTNINMLENCRYKSLNNRESSGLIFKGLSAVEEEFLYKFQKQRKPGVLTVALNQLYGDVFNVPLKFF